MCVYIYIYIYIEGERDRDVYVCIYIYIYIVLPTSVKRHSSRDSEGVGFAGVRLCIHMCVYIYIYIYSGHPIHQSVAGFLTKTMLDDRITHPPNK